MQKRKQVSLGTYTAIKEFFSKNKELIFAPTFIRDQLNLDYLSVKLVLDVLVKEGFIEKEGKKFKYKR